ncbi:MAG: carbohydrate kinase [Anaerolineales bacterium]|nr:carbohydrate kinase [Anaerolineales bacterium]
MSARFLLGIDAGTTIIKSTLFDLEGRELAGAAQNSSLLAPRPGWAEADMDVVWQAVITTVQQTVANANIQPDELLAIGITGQGDGTWLVNKDHRPVRNAILWSDGRTAPFVVACQRAGISSQLFQITGTALNACNQGAQLHWLQENEPATPAQTAAVLRAKDWVFLCMTGVISTDETDASHTYFAAANRAYDERVFQLLGIEGWRHAVPPAPPSAKQIGELLPSVARLLGLKPGTPVLAGPFDVAASALGAGAVTPGDACSVLGTASVHQIVVDMPVMEPADIGYNMCHAPADCYMRLLPAMTCTPNLQWFVDQAFAPELAAARTGGTNIWDHLEAIAGRMPLGANGVMYHPYLDPAGERAPIFAPHARAQFTGLSAHHTREDMLRAVYEGVALSVLDCYRWMSVPVTLLRLAGGGARSPLWGQMLADALGCPVEVAEGTEYGARGAVINAGVAIGVYASYATAVAQTVRPVGKREIVGFDTTWPERNMRKR